MPYFYSQFLVIKFIDIEAALAQILIICGKKNIGGEIMLIFSKSFINNNLSFYLLLQFLGNFDELAIGQVQKSRKQYKRILLISILN